MVGIQLRSFILGTTDAPKPKNLTPKCPYYLYLPHTPPLSPILLPQPHCGCSLLFLLFFYFPSHSSHSLCCFFLFQETVVSMEPLWLDLLPASTLGWGRVTSWSCVSSFNSPDISCLWATIGSLTLSCSIDFQSIPQRCTGVLKLSKSDLLITCENHNVFYSLWSLQYKTYWEAIRRFGVWV